jgi:hypothetical protein
VGSKFVTLSYSIPFSCTFPPVEPEGPSTTVPADARGYKLERHKCVEVLSMPTYLVPFRLRGIPGVCNCRCSDPHNLRCTVLHESECCLSSRGKWISRATISTYLCSRHFKPFEARQLIQGDAANFLLRNGGKSRSDYKFEHTYSF